MNAQQILEESANLNMLKQVQAERAAAGKPASIWVDEAIRRMEHRLENATAYHDPEEAHGWVDAPWWLWPAFGGALIALCLWRLAA
jgi:hypothetical protein